MYIEHVNEIGLLCVFIDFRNSPTSKETEQIKRKLIVGFFPNIHEQHIILIDDVALEHRVRVNTLTSPPLDVLRKCSIEMQTKIVFFSLCFYLATFNHLSICYVVCTLYMVVSTFSPFYRSNWNRPHLYLADAIKQQHSSDQSIDQTFSIKIQASFTLCRLYVAKIWLYHRGALISL